MAERGKKKSSVPMIAAVLSLLCAVGVAIFFLTNKQEERAPGTKPEPNPVLEIVNPAMTPKPLATQAPAATATPGTLIMATASAPVVVADGTTTRTLTKAGGVLMISGQVRDDGGMVVPGIDIFAVPYRPGGVQAAVRQALQKGQVSGKTASDSGGNFEQRLDADEAYYIGLLIDNEPQPFAQLVNERTGSTKETVRLTIPKPYEVRGTVVDENERPLPQIPLKITWRVNTLREGDAEMQSRELTTDDMGRFAQALFEPANVRVEIDAEKLAAPYLPPGKAVEMTHTDLEGTHEYRVDLRVIAGVRITGRVMMGEIGGTATKPLAGITITAQRIAGDKKFPAPGPMTTKSDESGDFRFDRLYPGIYRLTATDANYSVAPPQDVAAGDSTRQQFVLYPFSAVRGTLYVSGASAGDKVDVALMDRYDGWKQGATVGADGVARFEFPAVKPGTYLLTAECGNDTTRQYVEKKIEQAAGTSGDVGELKMQPLGEIRARLIMLTVGIKDFDEVSVSARPLSGDSDPFGGGAAHNEWRRAPATSLAEGGVVTLENVKPNVEYLLLVEKRATKEVIGSAVAALTTKQPIKIALDGTGNISGFVKNNRGEGCTETVVELRTGFGAVQGEAADIQVRHATTDFKGAYNFPYVPSGQCYIVLEGSPATSRLVGVMPGKDFNFDFACRSYVTVNFKMKDAEDKPFKDKEAFYIVPEPGTESEYPVRELRYGTMELKLEPGHYVITRMSTQGAKSFEISPRLDGDLTIDFTTPAP
ncbi:MAG: carboxypeptidase-like regulatory domain-containing protein [Candidatus Sumerlaeota bacterium]